MLILHTLQKLLKNDSMKLICSYFLWYFCHIQICNDDCWVICMLWSNVKSLFYHVTRRWQAIASLGTASERQDRQADSVVQVHTSHEPVQSSVQTSKHEQFTFIVHHLNSEPVHSSVQFIVLEWKVRMKDFTCFLQKTLSITTLCLKLNFMCINY